MAPIALLTPAQEERLLGRAVRPLLTAADRSAYAGARVLITGAGGSVGSELARQLAACGVARLTLVDHAEHNLFQIERELAEAGVGCTLDAVLADVTRSEALAQEFRRARPQIVFHAAAYKHVTMAERAVCAAARVNVLGTGAALIAARAVGARFVLISTDKAAAPQSVMGVTKRVAELVVVAAATRTFRTAVVRFGNILASSGSLVPLLLERIRQGRPAIITDPDATRYFMTVGEAASLVMKADLLARGGEVFWLDMGAPLRIGDLTARLLDVAEGDGWARVPIDIIGLRPGEKLVEQLTSQGLEMRPTGHAAIHVARQAPMGRARLDAAMAVLRRAIARGDALETLEAMAAAVPDFTASFQALAMARVERLYMRVAGRTRTA